MQGKVPCPHGQLEIEPATVTHPVGDCPLDLALQMPGLAQRDQRENTDGSVHCWRSNA